MRCSGNELYCGMAVGRGSRIVGSKPRSCDLAVENCRAKGRGATFKPFRATRRFCAWRLKRGLGSRFFSDRMRVRGSFGSFATCARNGSSVMLRKVTPWRAAGRFQSGRGYRCRAWRERAPQVPFADRARLRTAGNCHMREKSTWSCAPGSCTGLCGRADRAESRRRCGCSRVARLLRGAGISSVRPELVCAAPA